MSKTLPFRAISLIQPWASLVIWQLKQLETRSFPTKYRGHLLIHASKSKPRWAREASEHVKKRRNRPQPVPDPHIMAALEARGISFDDLPRGQVLGYCQLQGVQQIGTELQPEDLSDAEVAFGDYSPGRYAWQLGEIQEFAEHFPAKGSLSFWDVTPYIPEHLKDLFR